MYMGAKVIANKLEMATTAKLIAEPMATAGQSILSSKNMLVLNSYVAK